MKLEMPKIKFGDKEFYAIDKIKYEGKTYIYIMEDIYEDGMELENVSGNIEVNFIYKCAEGGYRNVTDDELFDKLMQLASKRIMLNMAEYLKIKD